MGAKKDFLAKLFKSMDTDGSGALDIHEVKVAMMKMGVHLGQGKFRRFFRLMDQNKTGSISYPDFHKLIFPEDNIKEKATANMIAMKHHAAKKKQYEKRETALYAQTFEGEFQAHINEREQVAQKIAQEKRNQGAAEETLRQNTRIMRIKSGQLSMLGEDNRAQKLIQLNNEKAKEYDFNDFDL